MSRRALPEKAMADVYRPKPEVEDIILWHDCNYTFIDGQTYATGSSDSIKELFERLNDEGYLS